MSQLQWNKYLSISHIHLELDMFLWTCSILLEFWFLSLVVFVCSSGHPLLCLQAWSSLISWKGEKKLIKLSMEWIEMEPESN